MAPATMMPYLLQRMLEKSCLPRLYVALIYNDLPACVAWKFQSAARQRRRRLQQASDKDSKASDKSMPRVDLIFTHRNTVVATLIASGDLATFFCKT